MFENKMNINEAETFNPITNHINMILTAKFIKRGLLTAAVLMTLSLSIAQAQWGLGASYELRNEDPQSGYGARIERTVDLTLLQLGFRGHFSYFSESNSLQQDITSGGSNFDISYSREISTYDYGVAVFGGVNIAFLKPYVGAGIGSDNVNVDYSNVEVPENEDIQLESIDDSKFYYNGFIGTELTSIPKLKPFIEYRFEKMQDPVQLKTTAENSNLGQIDDDKGRVILGVILRL